MRVALANRARPPSPIRIPDAAAPMGLNYNNMADTTNATYDGGIFAPHDCLSGANISINPETSKLFDNYFVSGIKNKGAQSLKPTPLMY